MSKKIRIYPDKEKLLTATAEHMVNFIARSVRENGRCSVSLSGGNTPGGVYSMLAESPYRDRVDWSRIHLFWGDERMVSPEHKDSNFRMVREALLDHIKIPGDNVHRIQGEVAPEQAAEEYEKLLKSHFQADMPRFDLVLLGLGEDGHTASIFPDTRAVEEYERNVVAVFVPRLNTWRVTLTLPVLNAAGEILFLVSGRSKSDIIRRIMSASEPVKELPASMVNPQNGQLYWMLDSEAMASIQER